MLPCAPSCTSVRSTLFAVLATVIICVLLAARQSSPVTSADYARAERFLAPAVTPLVVGGNVAATWLPDDRGATCRLRIRIHHRRSGEEDARSRFRTRDTRPTSSLGLLRQVAAGGRAAEGIPGPAAVILRRVTFDSTASSTGVICPSCRRRITRFQARSNFFQPAA